jgi:hypothetical protein
MSHIAKVDREAMNALFAKAVKMATPVDTHATEQGIEDHAEQKKVEDEVLREDAKELKDVKAASDKTAAKNEGWTEEAFSDHKAYLETLESILADDKKESWDPNDMILD